jgi:transposase
VLVSKQLEGVAFCWPPVVDGAVRLMTVEFAALFDGIDWTRVQATKRIPIPVAAASTPRRNAQVLVARYADHLPLYRQSQMLARQVLAIGREVLADWIGTAAQEISPVVRRMREILLASPRLFADETTMPVLDPGRGQVKKGFAWTIARDDRPWAGRDPPAVVFRNAPGRGKEHAAAMLAEYRGILQCDGYAAYKAFAAGGRRDLGILLELCAARVLRPGPRRRRTGRRGGAEADRRALRHRCRDPGQAGPGTPGHMGRTQPAVGGAAVHVARGATRPPGCQQPDGRDDPLRAEPPQWPGAVSGRWPHRGRHQHRGTRPPPDLP